MTATEYRPFDNSSWRRDSCQGCTRKKRKKWRTESVPCIDVFHVFAPRVIMRRVNPSLIALGYHRRRVADFFFFWVRVQCPFLIRGLYPKWGISLGARNRIQIGWRFSYDGVLLGFGRLVPRQLHLITHLLLNARQRNKIVLTTLLIDSNNNGFLPRNDLLAFTNKERLRASNR